MIMGAPFLSALFALPRLDPANLARGGFVLTAIFALALHVYFLNAWAGREHDKLDRNKQHWPTVAGAIAGDRVLALSLACLVAALAAFFSISTSALVLSTSIALLWIAYAHPGIAVKGVAIAPTCIHLLAGTLTTLLAQSAYSPPDRNGVLRGIYFGLVLSGGHLNHELLDLEADDKAGFRTSAICFGRRPVFVAALLLFTASTVLFCFLPRLGAVPPLAPVGLVLVLPLYVFWWASAWRSDLGHEDLLQFRSRYRVLWMLAGIWMGAAAIGSQLAR